MSTVITVKSSLGTGVNAELLKRTLEIIAQEEGVKIRNFVEVDSGTKYTSWEGYQILGAIATKKLPRGIGVIINEKGELIYAGDKYRCESEFQKMQERIDSTYSSLALILATQEAGFQILEAREVQDWTIIKGVSQ